MDTVRIGAAVVPALGFGTFPLRGDVLKKAVGAAMNAGFLWFDTAFRYGNESELGQVLNSSGTGDFVVSTKLSGLQYVGRKDWLYLNRISAKRALKDSKARLGISQMCMYMLHSPFRHYFKAYSELQKLYKEGAVKAIGVSGFQIHHLKRIKDYCGDFPQFDMIECHPLFNNSLLRDFCKQNNIQVIARSPFAHGQLLPELCGDVELSKLSQKYSKSVPQLILRWIVQQGMAAVVNSSNPDHIREDAAIFDFRLAESDMKYIDSLNLDRSYGVK